MRGRFITLEGVEGSGKSLQVKLLKKYLQGGGFKVIVTREPGNTRVGKIIRNILLDPGNVSLSGEAELFLYLADRAQHIKEVIEPHLKRGGIVVGDRFTDATVAYQGYGRRFPLRLVETMNKLATKGITPDLTIILDIPVKLGLSRAVKKGIRGGDRIEREKIAFHRRVRAGYMAIAGKARARVKVVKVKGAPGQVQAEIRQLVSVLMAKKSRKTPETGSIKYNGKSVAIAWRKMGKRGGRCLLRR